VRVPVTRSQARSLGKTDIGTAPQAASDAPRAPLSIVIAVCHRFELPLDPIATCSIVMDSSSRAPRSNAPRGVDVHVVSATGQDLPSVIHVCHTSLEYLVQ
jgi:hypothetical protein